MYKSFWTIIFSLVLALTVSGCHTPKSDVRSPSALIKHMGSSTVALVIRKTVERDDQKIDKTFVYCSAVWLSNTAIVTANHCVEAAYRNWVADHSTTEVDPDEVEVPDEISGFHMYYVVQDEVEGVGEETSAVHLAKVVARDKDHDVAMIKAEGKVIPPHTYAEIATTMPAVGEQVHVVGHVTGLYWTFVDATVSAYRDKMPLKWVKGPFVQISGPVWFGNSGGGAFDRDGKLIGIASFLNRAPQNSMFVHAKSIKDLFEVYKDVEK